MVVAKFKESRKTNELQSENCESVSKGKKRYLDRPLERGVGHDKVIQLESPIPVIC